MRLRLTLLLFAAALLSAPLALADNHDDDDSAGDDDDSAIAPDDATTYGWLCGVGAEDVLPAAPALLFVTVGLLARRQRD